MARSRPARAGGIQMTEGPLYKNILLFSVPLIFSQLLQVLFNMADVAVVGKFSSATALGSVGSTSTLATVYKGNIIKNLIMDCQSYTKYRPNETTGGILYHGGERRNFPRGLD